MLDPIGIIEIFLLLVYHNFITEQMEIIDWVKKQTGKIADNVKDYKFYVKHTPNYIDSSTTLTLTSFANRD